MNKTPAQEFMKRRRENPKDGDLNKPSKKMKRLPAHKNAGLVTSIGDIKTDPKDVKRFQDRKVSLISKKDFNNINQKIKDRDKLYGSLTIY